MQKVINYIILLFPLISIARNVPEYELENPQVPISKMEIILFFTAVYLVIYYIFKKRNKNGNNSKDE